MNLVLTALLAVQILSALVMIGLILVQHGKGADMGAAFGSGTSGSLFGASGSSNFLSRTTAALATVFFVSTLALAYFGNVRSGSSSSVLEGMVQPAVPALVPGAEQIPLNAPAGAASAPGSVPGSSSVPVPAAPGAGQIPSK